LKFAGGELVRSPPRPDFWRAPTDNERGRKMAETDPAKEARKKWKNARPPQGIWRHAHEETVVESFVATSKTDGRAVEVTVTLKLPKVDVVWTTRYTVFGDGEVNVAASFTPGDTGLPPLPRLGMQMILPAGFDHITWLGPGAQETYIDRQDAKVGLYSGAVDEQFYNDYVEPGESGNKVDVRWATITDRKGVGLLVVGEPLVSVNAMHHTTDDLQNAKHPFELPPRDFTVLNLDWKQQGLGGDTSWGAWPHDAYLIPCAAQGYSFRLRPISSTDNPEQLARVQFNQK
jgi:beta-galactosidase